jgi:hypothetical protein
MIITIKGADFSSANIGTLSTYIISKSIGSGASFDIPNFVDKNSSVNWTITLDEGYTFGTYLVTMGGVEVTPTVVDNVMTISIAEVTGNVRIVVATVNENGEEDDPTIPDEPTANYIEFLFNNNVENGVNLANIGTLSNGALTITNKQAVDFNGITFSNDKDWTMEWIALPSDATSLILTSCGNNVGGYVQTPNPTGAANGTLRFRDEARTMSVTWPWTTLYTEPKHFAIVYYAGPKLFRAYADYQELTGMKFESGSANTFNTFTTSKLFGGYVSGVGTPTETDYSFLGTIKYMKFTESALQTDEMLRQ